MIKKATKNIILVSPFVKVAPRLRDLIIDRATSGVDVRLVYGKSQLSARETSWLSGVDAIKTSYVENLHAKCYMTESHAVITSLNLYAFSQVNNYEMGVCFSRRSDAQLFESALAEVRTILRVGVEVQFGKSADELVEAEVVETAHEKLTTSKLAKEARISTDSALAELVKLGYLELREGKPYLTDAGVSAGGEFKFSKRFGPFFVWPRGILIGDSGKS